MRVKVAVRTGHILVDAMDGGVRVSQRPPITHHPSAEAEHATEVLIEHAGVAACLSAVDLVVRAHERRHARVHRRGKRRVVHLKHGAVGGVGRGGHSVSL